MEQITLYQIDFKNFKNLSSDCGVDFKNLNILIGPNGSGKSNFIQLLKFLSDSTNMTQDETRGRTSFDNAVLKMGGERALDASQKAPAAIEISYSFAFGNSSPYRLDIELRVQDGHRKPIINLETLSQDQFSNPKQPFYYYQCHNQQSGAGVVSYYVSPPSKETRFQKLENVPVDELALISIPRLLESSNIPPEKTPFYQVRRQIIDSVSNWRFYNANDMNLSAIRASEPNLGPSDLVLSASGENLPLVLENLSQQSVDFEEMLTEESRKFLPWTRKIRAARSGRLKLTIEWHMDIPQGKKEQFYLSEMSDGSVRMLCWATILLSPELPSLLVIEEPEIGIHVSWLPTLAAWVKKASEKTQVIVSTHSPDLLDYFTDNLLNVLVMKQSKSLSQEFCLKPLKPELLKDKLEEGWQLGDLYRVGDSRIGGWPW